MYNADSESTFFTIKMHHGGQVKRNSYIGGKIAYYDYCCTDKMSCLELEDMGNKLGYTVPFGFYYKDNNYDLQFVLHDGCIYEVAKACLDTTRVVEIFLEGPKTIPMDNVENESNDATEVEKEVAINVEDVEVEFEVNVDEEIDEFQNEVELEDGVNEGGKGEVADFIDEDYRVRDDDDLYNTFMKLMS